MTMKGRQDMKVRIGLAAGALALGIALAPALTASAATYIIAGTKSCTGSSRVYTVGVASGNHYHTHYGPDVRERSFEGNPFVYKTTYYYSGGLGTYTGYVSANTFGDVSSASIACDV
jgi:hypothetical protein